MPTRTNGEGRNAAVIVDPGLVRYSVTVTVFAFRRLPASKPVRQALDTWVPSRGPYLGGHISPSPGLGSPPSKRSGAWNGRGAATAARSKAISTAEGWTRRCPGVAPRRLTTRSWARMGAHGGAWGRMGAHGRRPSWKQHLEVVLHGDFDGLFEIVGPPHPVLAPPARIAVDASAPVTNNTDAPAELPVSMPASLPTLLGEKT